MIDPIGAQRGHVWVLTKRLHELLIKKSNIDEELERVTSMLEEQETILQNMIKNA